MSAFLLLLSLLISANPDANKDVCVCREKSFEAVSDEIKKTLETAGLDKENTGIVILDTGKKPLFSYNPDMMLKTASVMKVFTSAAALHYLKPEYTFKTKIFTDAPPVNGEIKGNLFVQAAGDPLFTPEQMTVLVAEFLQAGIKKIDGTIILDLSVHSGPLKPSSWNSFDANAGYTAPLAPLTFGFGSFNVDVKGEEAADKKPFVSVYPIVSTMKIINNSELVEKGRNTIKADVKDDGTIIEVEITGKIARGAKANEYKSVNHPDMFFAVAMMDALKKEGIAVNAKIANGTVPKEAKLLIKHESLPLGVIIRNMNLYSNNIMAEMLLRHIGGQVEGWPGTTEKGLRAVAKFLKESGIDTKWLDQKDGSGLTRDNKASPMVIAQLMQKMQDRFDISPDFLASLTTNGGEGTLAKQMKEPEFYRRFRGKNGYISTVYTASGYLRTDSGKTLIVTLMFNNTKLSFQKMLDVASVMTKAIMKY